MTKKRRRLFKPTVVFFSAVFLIFVIFFASLNLARQLYPTKYSDFVESYTLEYNLQKSFVYAVIKCESGFDERAVSSVGAKGLMQIMPETFLWLQGKTGEELSEEMLFDAEQQLANAQEERQSDNSSTIEERGHYSENLHALLSNPSELIKALRPHTSP